MKHLKHVKTNLNRYKHKQNPWITIGNKNSIKFRDEMFKRLRLTNCDSPTYETLQQLKNYNWILQRNINAAKNLLWIKIWQTCIKYKTNLDHHKLIAQ